MTSPNLPIGSANIPQGAFTHTSLAQVLQNFTSGKYVSEVGGRFPGIVSSTPAGSPLAALSPVGIITGLLGEFLKTVSESTSTDISHPADLDDLITGFFEGLPLVGEVIDLLQAILGTYTGDDPVFLQIQELFQFLRSDGMIDASKLFGDLPAHMLAVVQALVKALGGNIELGQLFRAQSGAERNWLEPFDTAASIDADANWSWDGTVGRTALGSATCILDGAEHVQHSDAVDAAAGQQVAVEGWVEWSGYSGSGAPFVLRVLAYSAGNAVVGSQVIGTVTPGGASGAWQQVAGTWTVPAGTAYVRVRMEALASATAGAVWFDDLALRKPAQSLPQAWVTGLEGALQDAADGLQELLDKIANAFGVPGSGLSLATLFGALQAIPQGNVTGLTGLFTKVQDFIDTIMHGFGYAGSGFSLGSLLSALGSIPQGNITGLGTSLGALLPKTDWTSFLTQAVGSAGSGSSGSTGVPAMDNALNAFASLFGKAAAAQSTATTVQGTVQQQAVTTGVADGLTVVYTAITSTGTWTRSAIPAGCTTRVKTGVGLVASGQGGARPVNAETFTGYNGTTSYNYNAGFGGRGGAGGGYVYADFDPTTVGTSQTVTIGAGGTGATTAGADGGFGGTTSFGSLLSIASGAGGGVPSSIGVMYAGGAGNGGNGGDLSGGAGPGSAVHIANSGAPGVSAYRVQGGTRGATGGGAGGSGQDGPTTDTLLSGGSGGGGGGAKNPFGTGGAGGAGGVPGGGGGGGGESTFGGNGGAGGRGEALIAEYFK